jgi:hypothetical protein
MTPIIFFAFNRPDTTQRVLEALSRQTKPIPRLIAFCDGARHDEEQALVQQVRQLLKAVTWTEVELVERERNYGLVENIVGGIDEVLGRYERAVIVEDDILTAPHFYETMCLLLDHYQSARNVFSVGGYPLILPDDLKKYSYDVLMSVRFSVWGWGTWSERWQELSVFIRDFQNPYGTADAVADEMGRDTQHLVRQLEKNPDFTWDVQVMVLSYYRGYLHALSRSYLVNNLGLETGVHGERMPAYFLRFIARNNPLHSALPQRLPPPVRDEQVAQAVKTYLLEAVRAAKFKYFAKLRYYLKRIPYHLKRVWHGLYKS